ncbi:MAG: TIGR01777 family protein [Merismopedia sp. SIO2A8]|nr:TIGR01777 family protein [Symploca sp. SIO2B6]NET53847.1 TIGR01777 family protein [Merismopedia sp. SIO2A8]
MKVAVTGATGFVGRRLVEKLQEQQHDIVVFTRNGTNAGTIFPTSAFPNVEIVAYTPTRSGPWQASISGCDGVVNLAGEPIAEGRWTSKRKQEIMESRQIGTEKVVEAIAQASRKPSVLISSSAIGYYGTSETATFDEASTPGSDFLAEVCKNWEAAAQKVTESGTRLVIIRTGIVLAMGGAIAKMYTPFQLFAGGPIGSGQQWVSWIHRDDLVALILRALSDSNICGVLNGTAPNPVRMSEFCREMGGVMNRPSWLPVPSFALEALLGDGAQVVLSGQQVLPKQTLATGFTYQYPTIAPALKEILVK